MCLSRTEEALSIRFLGSMILFSSTSKFEKSLKEEIWLCHKNMDLSMDDIYKMTVADRKTFIAIHNKEVEKENNRLKAKYKKK